MRRPWRIRKAEPALVSRLAGDLGVSPLTARLLVQRGLDSPGAARRHLQPAIEDLHDPFGLPDMERAASRVARALEGRERILVHGDYDVDGMIGASLLVQFGRLFGADVAAHIPDRARDGFSIREPAIERVRRERIGLVLTVDNGTGAVEAVDRLGKEGADVVVTDHHLPGPRCAPAYALVNPRLPGSRYPYPGLCGSGVAFKLAWAVAERLSPARKRSAPVQEFLHDALAAVAIATIADLAPLDGENRTLVRFGLAALRATTNPGLRALLESLAGRAPSAEDVAFRIAPRLNAAGRLGRQEVALECLTTPSHERAASCVRELERLNGKRQRLDRAATEEARARVRAEIDLAREPAILLASETWHPGILGLGAARLAEEFQRPVALVALSEGLGRASVRAPEGFHLPSILEACADLLVEFGGHPLAAGFEIRAENLGPLRRRLAETVRAPAPAPLAIDAELPLPSLTPALCREIGRLEPYGAGNEAPLFAAGGVEVLEPARRAPRGEWVLTLRERDAIVRARTRTAGLEGVPAGAEVSIAYTPLRPREGGEGEIRLRDLSEEPAPAFVA
ncbi:MAG: single-stranded-DNA-specific exonuclease RecJ [Planctomycetes bacterium]|nr:single-stranded-DNA-specific exonuclease RecJ [Planctomycetota bacterium]